MVRSFSNQDLLFFLLFQLIISSHTLLQDAMIWTLRREQFQTDLLIPANVFPQIFKEEQFWSLSFLVIEMEGRREV